jgi:hypothetical protein
MPSCFQQAEQEQIAGIYWVWLLKLFHAGALGDYYLRRMLIYGDFTLRKEDRYMGPLPNWMR